ncbi:hypothetical protein SUDANB106_00335 [Streptomyces sp. enrichment culture]
MRLVDTGLRQCLIAAGDHDEALALHRDVLGPGARGDAAFEGMPRFARPRGR